MDLSASGRLLATSVGAGCKVFRLGYAAVSEEESAAREGGKDETVGEAKKDEGGSSYVLEEVASFVTGMSLCVGWLEVVG